MEYFDQLVILPTEDVTNFRTYFPDENWTCPPKISEQEVGPVLLLKMTIYKETRQSPASQKWIKI